MLKHFMIAACALAFAAAAAAQQQPDVDELRSLTSSVLASLGGAKEEPETRPGDLKIIVEQAIAEGRSDEYLDALINEAAEKGEIEVPAGMRTTEGKVDTKVLLASLVRKSMGDPEGDAETLTATLLDEADGAAGAEGERFYVVVAGDSLAALAKRFYGDPFAYEKIFLANTDQIGDPDTILIGQRLVIPR